jgi:hypothetical protein
MKHDPSLTDLRALFGADEFHARHIGPGSEDETRMLAAIGYASRRDLIRDTVPASILREAPLAIVEPTTEAAALAELESLAEPLEHYQPFHAVRADLLSRAGQTQAARIAYTRAIDLSGTEAERAFLLARAKTLTSQAKKKPGARPG